MNIEHLKQLSRWEITVGIAAFLATVAPGFLLLWQYQPELLVKLSSTKIIVFSAALTLPVIAINSFIFVVAGAWQNLWETLNVKQAVFFEAVWAFFSLYFSLLLAYILGFSFSSFLFVLATVNTLVGFAVLRVVRYLSASEI